MNYIIPIGGTGARVTRAMVFLAMAGCFNGEKFKIMCIDSDESNGDVKRLENVINTYQKVRKKLENEKLTNKEHNDYIFPEIVSADIDKNAGKKLVWSPLSSEDTNSNMSMSEMVRESTMSNKIRDVYDFLYSKSERDKKLVGGFYGHTSIGSYFMARQIVEDGKYTAVWADFFNNINEKEDKVFIIGSIFGGTGASGVPTVARILHEMEETKNLPIGAIFLQPYFKPILRKDDNHALKIDWNTFTTKTKIALEYYSKQGYNNVFREMYFIGEDNDENFMFVKNNECGDTQENKANVIEVIAATALLDFISRDYSDNTQSFNTRFTEKVLRENEKSAVITKDSLKVTKQKNLFKNIEKFLKFSILFNRYYYHLIKYNEQDIGFHYRDIDLETADEMYAMCQSYVAWIRDIIVKTDDSGITDYEKCNEDILWFNSKYEELFSSRVLENKISGGKILKFLQSRVYDYSKLDNMENLTKEKEMQKKGKDLIYDLLDKNGSGGLKNLIMDFYEICE